MDIGRALVIDEAARLPLCHDEETEGAINTLEGNLNGTKAAINPTERRAKLVKLRR